jgi:hypothetical protein
MAAAMPEAGPGRPTLRQESLLVAVTFLIVAGGGVLSAILFPEVVARSGTALPLFFLRALAHNIGHAWWITLDCRRRGREISGWRAMAFWFGALVVPIYLVAEYRSTAAVYIPLYFAIESTALASEPVAFMVLYSGPALTW